MRVGIIGSRGDYKVLRYTDNYCYDDFKAVLGIVKGYISGGSGLVNIDSDDVDDVISGVCNITISYDSGRVTGVSICDVEPGADIVIVSDVVSMVYNVFLGA